MKYITISCFALFISIGQQLSGQTLVPHPIPCIDVTPASIGALPSGVQANDCITVEGETVNFNPAQNYSIKAGEFIEMNANTVIQPDAVHQFHAFIEGTGLDLAWYTPNSTPGIVERYDKLELGVQFENTIKTKIEHFIDNTPGPQLNPFNPDEVDLYAEFFLFYDGVWNLVKKVNGFYYEEFQREINEWDTVETAHDFRIRFSPNSTGNWKCKISAAVSGHGILNAHEFTFQCVPSDREGFVEVGINKRYFNRGGKPFFPVGHNLFGPSHDSAANATSSIPEYIDYYNEMRELSENGANYFRHIVCPWNTEIEFEHLGNYANRMINAWEMDNMLDSAAAFDLVMHLNMAIHYTFERPIELHQQRYWDWARAGDSLTNPVTGPDVGCFNSNDSGYCYRNELAMEDPINFFDDPLAQSFYKKRIRYMLARWGYSTQIGIWEILSESNHTGRAATIEWIPGVACETIPELLYEPYTDIPDIFPERLYNWHHTMAEYMHTELDVNQPISANYTGIPDVENSDFTLKSPYIDVATYNEYRIEIDKYEDSYITSEGRFHADTSSAYADKPFMHSEYGMGDEKIYECDNNSTFIKRAVLTPFTGLATSAITWDDQKNERDTWKHLRTIREFMEDIPLDADNWRAQKPIVTPDKAIEVFYLRNFDEVGYRAAGVVSNRTYNFFTQAEGDSTNCLKPDRLEFTIEGGDIYLESQNFIGADYETEMVLPNMGWLKHYSIQWFNAITGNLIFTEGRWTNTSSELPIEFPLLTGDETQPLVFFQVYPWNEPEFKTPIQLENTNTAINNFVGQETSENENTTLALENLTDWPSEPIITLSPNPAKNRVKINVTGYDTRTIEWQLTNGLGTIIKTGKTNESNFTLDLSVYSNGIYFLTLKNLDYVTKIIKQ